MPRKNRRTRSKSIRRSTRRSTIRSTRRSIRRSIRRKNLRRSTRKSLRKSNRRRSLRRTNRRSQKRSNRRSQKRSKRRSTKNNVVGDQEGGAGLFQGFRKSLPNPFSKKKPTGDQSPIPPERTRPGESPVALRERLGEEGVEGISPEELLKRVKDMEEKISELEDNCANTGDIDDSDGSVSGSSELSSVGSSESTYGAVKNLLTGEEMDRVKNIAKLRKGNEAAGDKLEKRLRSRKAQNQADDGESENRQADVVAEEAQSREAAVAGEGADGDDGESGSSENRKANVRAENVLGGPRRSG